MECATLDSELVFGGICFCLGGFSACILAFALAHRKPPRKAGKGGKGGSSGCSQD